MDWTFFRRDCLRRAGSQLWFGFPVLGIFIYSKAPGAETGLSLILGTLCPVSVHMKSWD